MVKYSLIIPTLGRTIQLQALLETLKISSYKDFEVIIVDQNEDNRLKTIISSFSSSLFIKHLKVSFKGATKARNYGFMESQGKYVMFPDDDCEFFSDTLLIIDRILEELKPAVLCGRCIDRNGNDSVCTFSKKSGYLNEKNHQGKYVEFSEIFDRKIFSQYMYDENIGVGNFYGSGEALDQMIRMLRAGVNIYYSTSVCFYHPSKTLDHRSSTEINRAFYYACGFSYVCKKHSINYANKRIIKVILYIAYCLIIHKELVAFYQSELAGLLAGKNVVI